MKKLLFWIIFILCIVGFFFLLNTKIETSEAIDETYIVLDEKPNFSEEEYQLSSYESYSELDSLGRCGVAFASISTDLMPKEKRKSISHITPTGWNQMKYDWISGKYLYNRCHLIGYQLTGENDNERNLITCTRSMNVEGMLIFENQVAEYVKKTGKEVLYRVTPVFEGNNLLASGVKIEASSVYDHCQDICLNVYVYNKEAGVTIDYKTGKNWATELSSPF